MLVVKRSAHVKVKDAGWLPHLEKLAAGPSYVDVGFWGEKGDALHHDSELSVTEIAHHMEYGFYNAMIEKYIEARSFMRSTFDMYFTQIEKLANELAYQVILGKLSKTDMMMKLGTFLQKKIQERIKDPSEFRKNEKLTIRRKGFDNPLTETGQMHDAVDVRVGAAK